MSKKNIREVVEWEDTLSQSELAYAEKLQKENEAIQIFKQAQEEDTISGHLIALSLKHVPQEFHKVKREFQLRLHELIQKEAELSHFKARSYEGSSVIHMHLDPNYESLVNIDTKNKELHVNSKRWLNEFSKYVNDEVLTWREEWLVHKKKGVESRTAKSREDLPQEEVLIEKYEKALKKDRAEWEEGGSDLLIDEVVQEVYRLVSVMEKEGYRILIQGIEREAHYMMKARYRWEEDHSKLMSKWQRKFALPVNQPTNDDRHSHFGSGMVERRVGTLFVLTTPDNEYTREFYDRRFSNEEWNTLRNIPNLTNFEVLAGYEQVVLTYKPIGTQITLYPNGHVWVKVPENSDPNLLTTHLALLPFLWHPGIQEFFNEMSKLDNY